MEHQLPNALCDPDVQTVLAALEQQLTVLDDLGAHIAAAHVDAAIEQLRRDNSTR